MIPAVKKIKELRYGENPHQKAALYQFNQELYNNHFQQLNGKELSYNNIIDLESAWNIVKEFNAPGSVVIKHTNPCGAAVAEDLKTAYVKSVDSDPVSAFGSIIGLNRTVDEQTALEMKSLFIEAIIAPDYSEKALEILQQKQNLRLIKLTNFNQHNDYSFQTVMGGFLVQTKDQVKVNNQDFNCVTKAEPRSTQLQDLEMANTVVKYVKSNAIVIVKDGQIVGVGAGQMSRVEAVKIAIDKAGDKAAGAVLASDAFFPFKDSIELASKANIDAIVQPGGSKRDDESVECCNENEIAMVFTGVRHFRH